MEDLTGIHNLMDKLFYDTAYTIIDENGVDLEMELGLPGWLDLKKVLFRFFSKIKIDREFERFEEEVEGTGLISPIRRKDACKFLLKISKEDDKKDDKEDDNEEININK